MNIGGIVKNSFVDYPSKISCVIFTNGCNMNCWYCHNKHLLNNNNDNNKSKLSEQEVLEFLKERKSFLDAVVISGGEPTLQNNLQDFIKKLKDIGYLVKLDTNGSNYEVLKNLIEKKLVDYVAMDIKAPLDNYSLISPEYNIDSIKKCISLLKQGYISYEFRTTFSPDLTLEDIEKIAKDIVGANTYCIQQYRCPQNIENQQFFNDNKTLSNSYNHYKYKLVPIEESVIFNAKKIAEKYVKNVIIKGL